MERKQQPERWVCLASLCDTSFAITIDQKHVIVEEQSLVIERDTNHFAVFNIQDKNSAFPCFVTVTPDSVAVSLNGYTYRFRVLRAEEYPLYQIVQSVREQQQHQIIVRAPMPGLIKSVTVEPGLTVEHGQRLCILEAMKMENDILAPQSGVVAKVMIQPGQAVEKNAILCILEPAREHPSNANSKP